MPLTAWCRGRRLSRSMDNQQPYGDEQYQAKQLVWQLVGWGIVAAGGAWLQGDTAAAAGVTLGIVVSIVNFLLMCRKVKQIAGMPVEKAVAYMRLGWIQRLVLVVAVVFIAIKTPGIQVWGVIVGIVSLYVLIGINAWLFAFRQMVRKK